MAGCEYFPDEAGWKVRRCADEWEYQQQATLSGAAQNIDLNIGGMPMQFDRVEIFADDTTSKSYTVQIFNGGVDTSAFVQLASFQANTDQSNFVQGGIEYRYVQLPIRFRIAVTASTLNKKLTIKWVLKQIRPGAT